MDKKPREVLEVSKVNSILNKASIAIKKGLVENTFVITSDAGSVELVYLTLPSKRILKFGFSKTWTEYEYLNEKHNVVFNSTSKGQMIAELEDIIDGLETRP